jgi:predicted P-loop ATPase
MLLSVFTTRGFPLFTLSKSFPEMKRQRTVESEIERDTEIQKEKGKERQSPAVSGSMNTMPAAMKLTEAKMRIDCNTELDDETTKGEKNPPTCDIKQAIE